MDATNMVTSTDTVVRGYNCQGHPAHQTTITHEADIHRTLDTQQINVMIEEVRADPTLGYTRETEVQVAQDTPAQTDRHTSRDRNTGQRHTDLTTIEPRAICPTDSDRAITDHRPHTPGTILGVDHPHATTKNHIDIA